MISHEYFFDLFTSRELGDVNHILYGEDNCIPRDMNAYLVTMYEREEVYTTLKSMAPTKALGLDGLPALFFQKY